MVTGALAASYYGRARTTLDMDVVISIRRQQLGTLVRALSKAHLDVQEERLLATWKAGYGIATIEDVKSPHTLDIMFTDKKLERNAGRFLNIPTYYQTAESLILAKLRMLKVTLEAERTAVDRQDIRAILEAKQIDLTDLPRRARAETTVRILDDILQHAKLKAMRSKNRSLG